MYFCKAAKAMKNLFVLTQYVGGYEFVLAHGTNGFAFGYA
jgi:anaerobic glycerol-3-phosphate dehydrogenase